ncbi:hypothetical protein ACHAPE_004066 [Trichoderma viride]
MKNHHRDLQPLAIELAGWWGVYLRPQPVGQQGPTRLSLEKRPALQHDVEEDEVEDLFLDFENHKDTDYKIIGSNITITRRKWSWSMTDEDDTKLLMANTLHEPDWAEH